ncbi:aspartate aminotransferase family protein [Methylomusa anaerophila]|uniref:Acetylornithine/acetyl-lysine aminotransferase n=1 Tax=Methylomusa anaerophila TaxID=1930071 RepID=A0A348AEK5_9FIRM|nr:aminotransferase class III-fold pyridoxal phosphate-dependent enzyme [Methylomusa anaerophila]BBB89503.1 acetylornithine/acetyl-lysine aminotransferase [Methylomusa anaerophila]
MHFTNTNPKLELCVIRAEGSLLFDDSGKKYIDFICGRGTANLGHCHPIIVKAIQQQASRMIHFTNEIRMPIQEEYVNRLGEILPEFDTVFLTNSGAETIEAAIKISRLHTGRTEILSFSNGFHGRSMGALSATDGQKIRAPFYPLVPDFTICEPTIESVQENISSNTAAIIIEPIQGAGGVIIFPYKFLKSLRDIASKKGIMLVFDECQCGFGRTGNYFAFQKFEITPDILVASKTICGGIPAGGMFTRLIDFPEDLHGGTFCGNPLACAAGIGVLDVFISENILTKVA